MPYGLFRPLSVMDNEKNEEDEDLSQTELLLLPQHYIKGILEKSPETSYLDIVGKAPKLSTHEKKQAMSQLDLEAKASKLAKEKAEQLSAVEAAAAASKKRDRSSKLETTLILKANLKSPDEVFALFCWNLTTLDILHLATLNKRIHERVLQASFHLPLDTKSFVNFANMYCNIGRSNGIIESCALGVGSPPSVFFMKVEIGPYSIDTPFTHEKFALTADEIISRERWGKKVTAGDVYSTSLSSLITCKSVDSAGLTSLTELFLQHKGGFTLTSLDLCFSEYIEEPKVFSFLNALQTPLAQSIETLNFEGCNLGPNGISTLQEVIKKGALPNLLELNLDRNGGGELGVKKIRLAIMQGHCPRLRSLNVGWNGATNSVLDFFDTVIAKKIEFLKHLSACTNNIDLSDSTIAPTIVRGLITFRNLLSLDLSFNPLGDSEWVKVMKAAWPLTTKEEKDFLFVEAVGATKEAIKVKPEKVFDQQQQQHQHYEDIPLKRLVLNQTQIGDRSAAYLAALINMGRLKCLRHLSVGENELLQKGAEFILRALPNSSLRVIEMQLNGLGNEGVILFVNGAISGLLKDLEYLDVSDIGANSEHCNQLVRTIATLDEITKMKRLKNLRVYGTSPFCSSEVRCILPHSFKEKVEVS